MGALQRVRAFILTSRHVNNIFLAARRQTLGQRDLGDLPKDIDAQQFRFDLGELAEYGFSHAREKEPAGTGAAGRGPVQVGQLHSANTKKGFGEITTRDN